MTGAGALRPTRFVWIRAAFENPSSAFTAARELIEEDWASEKGRLGVIGDFVLAPLHGAAARSFQTLHFDFGIPVDPQSPQDLARYTALTIPTSALEVSASTRLVALSALLAQRQWPERATLLADLIGYGKSHGSWAGSEGYSEGSLARLLEAAAGSARLPSVKTDPDFLCGMEFDSLAAEEAFLHRLGLDVQAVEVEIPLRPGDLLVFDNLAYAHGRRGSRKAGELHQRIYGQRSMSVAGQRAVRDRFLSAFAPARAY
jgi:hypothetical protein